MQEYGATPYKNTGPDVQVYGTVHSSIRYQFKYTGQRRDVDPSSEFGTRVLEFFPLPKCPVLLFEPRSSSHRKALRPRSGFHCLLFLACFHWFQRDLSACARPLSRHDEPPHLNSSVVLLQSTISRTSRMERTRLWTHRLHRWHRRLT